MMNGYGDGGWWALAMLFMSLAFIAMIVVCAVFVVRSLSQREERPRARPEGNRALDLLDERFARAEIDQAEYEERRRVLTDGR